MKVEHEKVIQQPSTSSNEVLTLVSTFFTT